MDLLILFGPPASGKMTVGRSLCARTRYRLFHNHMTIEPLLGLFEFGHPSFNRLSGSFRGQILAECLAQDAFDLVFTFVWAVDLPSERRYLQAMADQVAASGGTTRYAELVCDLDERLQRNRTPERLDAKRSKRDLARSEANLLDLQRDHRMTSRPGELDDLEYYVRVENGALSADAAAQRIIDAFDLPVLPVPRR
jgi:hypothetical protein